MIILICHGHANPTASATKDVLSRNVNLEARLIREVLKRPTETVNGPQDSVLRAIYLVAGVGFETCDTLTPTG